MSSGRAPAAAEADGQRSLCQGWGERVSQPQAMLPRQLRASAVTGRVVIVLAGTEILAPYARIQSTPGR